MGASRKKILLLIGPKGSGKSFIGNYIQQTFGVRFVRVEDWVKDLRRGREIDDNSYLAEVFGTIENGLRRVLGVENSIVFESTGLTDYFDKMLTSLKNDFRVLTIFIEADPELCLKR